MYKKIEKVHYKGNYIEININQTNAGDFIATAKLAGSFSMGMGVCRHSNLTIAKKLCVERLLMYKK